MKHFRSRWPLVLTGLVVVVGLPLAGHWCRRIPDSRCALDGGPLDPCYQVHVVDASGQARWFCCVHCAEVWLVQQASPPRSVRVTDEKTGREIDAASAWYVRSLVVTTPTTGNRIHVFRTIRDAHQHAAKSRGTLLRGEARPFRGSRAEDNSTTLRRPALE